MNKYDIDDVIPFYFVIATDEHGKQQIEAWTDDKQLAKFYMDFHNCKNYQLKVISDKSVKFIGSIIDDCIHSEIGIYNIIVRDRNKKHGEPKFISVPATVTEIQFINSDTQSYFASYVDYSYINTAIPYLKDKWQTVLNDILLNDVVKFVVHNKQSIYLQHIGMDQLALFCKSFPDHFGK